MTQGASSRPTPRLRAVLREQIRAVALVLRLPAILAACAMGAAMILAIAEVATGGAGVDFTPELSMFPGIVGALLPIGVWKGEERFGTTLLWTMPVDRRQHALAKVYAGWVCLMAAVLAFFLWYLVIALVTGGNVLAEQTVKVLPATIPLDAAFDASALQSVRWKPHPVLWLVPFTAATGMYVIASAIALGSRHPWRWMIGAFLGAILFSVVGALAGVEWAKFGPSRLVEVLNAGRYGLDALLTARTESLHTQVLVSGSAVSFWRALPELSHWAIATLLWTGAGFLALWGAASRHREERPG